MPDSVAQASGHHSVRRRDGSSWWIAKRTTNTPTQSPNTTHASRRSCKTSGTCPPIAIEPRCNRRPAPPRRPAGRPDTRGATAPRSDSLWKAPADWRRQSVSTSKNARRTARSRPRLPQDSRTPPRRPRRPSRGNVAATQSPPQRRPSRTRSKRRRSNTVCAAPVRLAWKASVYACRPPLRWVGRELFTAFSIPNDRCGSRTGRWSVDGGACLAASACI